MNLDLEMLLVIGTLLTGGIWLIDRLFSSRRIKLAARDEHGEAQARSAVYKEPWYVEYSKSFFPVLFIVLILRAFVAEPFRIPSGSMIPTLLVGDFILVNKFAYDLRLPILHTKLLETGDPQRGDVIVFRYPQNPSDDYIKRVVGLPGDRIGYYDKVLYINGKRACQQLIGKFEGSGSGSEPSDAKVLEEEIGHDWHKILIEPNNLSTESEYEVPPGRYFVLGDNRDNSNDSRFWGFVPDKNLVGKAFMIWLHWDLAGGVFDFTRIGNLID